MFDLTDWYRFFKNTKCNVGKRLRAHSHSHTLLAGTKIGLTSLGDSLAIAINFFPRNFIS